MPQLYITKIKPNPTGKDLSRYGIASQQLSAEWVDIKNTTGHSLLLKDVVLEHIAYGPDYPPNGIWETAISFVGKLNVLGSNETVRVHSGGDINVNLLRPEDRLGADYHIFTGKGYIWNNQQQDSPRVVFLENYVKTEIDKATYGPRPQEGKILTRIEERLI